MKRSKKLQACIDFYRFMDRHEIDELDLAHLIELSQKAFKAAERERSVGVSADRYRRRVEVKAEMLGFRVEWNRLGPTLIKDGKSYFLPEV